MSNMIYQQPQTAAVAPVATSSIWQHVRAAVVALIVFTP
ncbi:MAG: hypothetical protein AVDCRST_MAG93-7354 [uncultured Chloroflexia bacterium]|uniref:Uncharacterized protein n=1 Tax=uncultured Chloroflexia bacterium TaxID=1672391 RepID=A0A6J4MDT1_9CHLR|nr:MAG: hypothetical protein AVDCRST_MAG93-7354 [uncultured Chloroflexia bacterium]